jgi:hypothetical protein
VPQAFAEQWVKVVTYPNGSEEYVDLESIKFTDEGLTQFWSKTDYPKPMQYKRKVVLPESGAHLDQLREAHLRDPEEHRLQLPRRSGVQRDRYAL